MNLVSLSGSGSRSQLDTFIAIETPEGVSLELAVAGPVVRALAWAIDFLLRCLGYLIGASSLPYLGEFGIGLSLLALFLVEWTYPVLFEVLSSGQTPGKRALGIRVLHETGVPVGWSTSVVRNLLRVVDFLPLAYGFGLVAMLLTRDFQRLGDLAAGTIVVYTGAPSGTVARPEVPPMAPPVMLRTEEQLAVLSFAERSSGLSPARARELASIAEPLTGARGALAVKRLNQIASWLRGER